MKSIRKLVAGLALALVLFTSVLAGEIQTPGANNPPPPPPPEITIRAIVDQLLAAFLFHKA